MATKIRLQRQGKKGNPYYHIVVSDSRAKRDGKFIERLGMYNPTSNPATIEIDVDRSVYWVQLGAQPTDTCRAILSYKGVLYKNHLLNGIKKGALTQEQADAKYATWLGEKTGKIDTKKDNLKKSKETQIAARLKAESEYRTAKELAQAKMAETAQEEVVAVSEEVATPEVAETTAE